MGLQILNTDLPVIIVQPFPNCPVPITFGYATGVGDQKSCAAVQGVIFLHRYSGEVIADIYISISMGTFGHRKYKSRGEDGNK